MNIQRNIDIARSCINRLDLDLEGLSVLTECASGPYSFTPIIAAMAGAKVMSFGRDSKYGSFSENKAFIQRICSSLQINGEIKFFYNELPPEKWHEVNVVTNSGMLRPFTKEKIEKLNSKAMISLMWETWELRDGEIDLKSCQQNGVPVVGTNEHFEKADMFCYPGMLCLKMLFEMGLEVGNNSFVLLGEGLTGSLIARDFRRLGIDFDWFVDSEEKHDIEGGCYHYKQIERILNKERIDAIICADHVSRIPVIGQNRPLDFARLVSSFPHIQWAHLTGPIDHEGIKLSGIRYYPTQIQSPGYMTYPTENLGWEPVIILNAAGLKVGEIVAKARMNGLNIEDSIQASVDYGIGQDFEGGFMNFNLS